MTDWLMPEMNGFELVQWIRANIRPIPFLVMITSLGSREAQIQALESGVDAYLVKPVVLRYLSDVLGGIEHRFGDAVSRAVIQKLSIRKTRSVNSSGVVMVAGTGGALALRAIFKQLGSGQDVTYFVVLHGPGWATEAFVEQLRGEVSMHVAIPEDGEKIEQGAVYLAPGDRHMLIASEENVIRLVDTPPENYLRPSADPLMRSAAEIYGRSAIGVVLGGPGSDASVGCGYMKVAGGRVIVQEPSDTMCSQMTGHIVRLGLHDIVVPLNAVAPAMLDMMQKNRSPIGAALPGWVS
jgi:two-component system chemotaxis response regulator CheB